MSEITFENIKPILKEAINEKDTINEIIAYTINAIYQKGLNDNNTQKIGHWIPKHIGQVTSYQCSLCGRFILDDTGNEVTKDYPFCNCGAKMEGGE